MMDGIWLPLTREELTRIADGEVVAIDIPDVNAPDGETVTRVMLSRKERNEPPHAHCATANGVHVGWCVED